MGFLKGKRLLITGMLSADSLAYGVAQACFREGASLAFTYHNPSVATRVRKLAARFESDLCLPCDVTSDAEIAAAFDKLSENWGGMDGLLHAVAFAPAEAITGSFLNGASRQSFATAHDVSSYSFVALAKAAAPLMRDHCGALLTLSYIGAQRVLPGYNMMGLAKASLEAGVRYLAADLGTRNIRVNGISSAPVRTIASSGLGQIEVLLRDQKSRALLEREIANEEVGNAAAFLLSDLAAGITGQIIYVDGGFSVNECSKTTSEAGPAVMA